MVDSSYYWYLTDTDDSQLIMSDLLFPATGDYYDYSNSDLTFEDLPSFYENVEITDGFILAARNATYEAPSTNSFAETTADDNLDTEIIFGGIKSDRSEEHTSELQSQAYLVCRLLLEKKK